MQVIIEAMTTNYVYLSNLVDQVQVPDNGILSKTLQNDERTKLVLFGFAPGQELSAHTAPFPATLVFLKGDATLQLGADILDAHTGTFAYMPPLLEHGIRAKTEVVMLLTMVKNPQG
jgi:quercetin dioxygenase-like cupin family protein